jgi:hypothetical protein
MRNEKLKIKSLPKPQEALPINATPANYLCKLLTCVFSLILKFASSASSVAVLNLSSAEPGTDLVTPVMNEDKGG